LRFSRTILPFRCVLCHNAYLAYCHLLPRSLTLARSHACVCLSRSLASLLSFCLPPAKHAVASRTDSVISAHCRGGCISSCVLFCQQRALAGSSLCRSRTGCSVSLFYSASPLFCYYRLPAFSARILCRSCSLCITHRASWTRSVARVIAFTALSACYCLLYTLRAHLYLLCPTVWIFASANMPAAPLLLRATCHHRYTAFSSPAARLDRTISLPMLAALRAWVAGGRAGACQHSRFHRITYILRSPAVRLPPAHRHRPHRLTTACTPNRSLSRSPLATAQRCLRHAVPFAFSLRRYLCALLAGHSLDPLLPLLCRLLDHLDAFCLPSSPTCRLVSIFMLPPAHAYRSPGLRICAAAMHLPLALCL